MRTLCYVASPSYSGSTLLAFLLGTHPRIATVGELKGRLYGSLEVPRRCSCGRELRECPFWKEVAQRLEARGVPCDLCDLHTYFHAPRRPPVDRLLRARVRGPFFEAARDAAIRWWPGARDELGRILERNRAAVEVICEIQGGDVLLDSSKDAVRLKFLIESDFWDVKLIHLIRDGRGTANSFVKRDRFRMDRAARRWKTAHEAYERLAARVGPEAVHRLRYEDLASAPQAAINAALDFLGLPRDQLSFDFRTVEHHIFGNPMRLESSSEILVDEGWRAELGREDLATFDRIAGDLNRRFGYAP